MRRSERIVGIGAALAATAGAMASACSVNLDDCSQYPLAKCLGTGAGGSGAGGSGTGGSTTSNGGASPGLEPPPPGPTVAPDGTGSVVFAIRRLYLGDSDRDGSLDLQHGWQQYGYDLDQRISTADSKDLCLPRDNAATKALYPDGDQGIDNSFGKNLLPIFLGLAPDFPAQVDASIAGGRWTLLLALENLGAGTEYNPLVARLYQGGDLGQAPQWMGSDAWPVLSDSLGAPPDLTSAKVSTAQSYVVGDTWVARLTGDLTLSLEMAGGVVVPVLIRAPIVTLQLDAARQHPTHGTIAGVIPTDAFVTGTRQSFGQFDPSLCTGPTIDSIDAQIAQASDILVDGTQDPLTTCTGISIGLGFDAERVTLGPVQTPPTPPMPCP
jgi:hypothetical protein